MKWVLNLVIGTFIFFPERSFYEHPRDYGLVEREVFFETADHVRLMGWFFEALNPRATLLFFHGNAGNISGRLFKAKTWLEKGVSVFLVDYRGYGRSEGRIEKSRDLLEDGRAALRWLEDEKGLSSNQVILYGESIGSHPAISLASEKKFAGVILEAPFTTLYELARTHYAWVPEFLLKDFQMDNQELIPGAQAPVFILHGNQDEVCPLTMGERLYELAPAPKELYVVQGGNHNNLHEVALTSYVDYPYTFLAGENQW